MKLAPVLTLSTPENAPERALLPPRWPDRKSIESPGTLLLVEGDAPGESWYALPDGKHPVQRALLATGRSRGGNEMHREVFLSESRPGRYELRKARNGGASVATLWIPVRPVQGDGMAAEYAIESRCLALVRESGFDRVRLLMIVPTGTAEKSYRKALDFLLTDRQPAELYSFYLQEGEATTGEADDEESLSRFRFFAALFPMTRCDKVHNDSIWIVLTDSVMRSHVEMVADLSYNMHAPSERLRRMRKKVEDLKAQLPAPPPPPRLSWVGKVKERARDRLPEPAWEVLRRVKRIVLPPKEL